MKYLNLLGVLIFIVLASCGGEEGQNFTQRMNNISETIKKIDTINAKISKGASRFASGVEKYVDTTEYKKDSTGMWRKK